MRVRKRFFTTAVFAILWALGQSVPAHAEDLRCLDLDFDGNGYRGALQLSIDQNGNVSGTVYGDPIQGYFNNVSNEIMFIRSPNGSGNPADQQVFTGIYWQEQSLDMLAGTFEAFANSGGNANRHRWGWFAACQIIG